MRGKIFSCSSLANLQLRSGVFEFFVFDELADEFPARIFAFLLVFDLHLLIDGQKFAALDVHERGGHHEEFAGDVEIEHAHDFDVFDELGGELGEVDFVNIDFFLPDEVEKQIERAFEDFKFDFVFGHFFGAFAGGKSKSSVGDWQRFTLFASTTGKKIRISRDQNFPV